MSISSTPSNSQTETAPGVDPLQVLQNYWKVLAVIALVGGAAGAGAAQLRQPRSDGECSIAIGVVPADPTRPGDRLLPLRSVDRTLAWLRAKPTLENLVGADAKAFELQDTETRTVDAALHCA